MRYLALILATTALSGCFSVGWPPARGGGMAETVPAERHAIALAAAHPAETALLDRLETLESDLTVAMGHGAMTYVPAETTLARRLCARIRREIAGTLYSDAAQNLIELADRVAIIDRAVSGPIDTDEDTAI